MAEFNIETVAPVLIFIGNVSSMVVSSMVVGQLFRLVFGSSGERSCKFFSGLVQSALPFRS